MGIEVNVVPHTHWDREWYKPYPVFRMQLVELLDGLLPELSTDEGYAHFQLDGQMAVVDDYLELRPFERDRLAELNRIGKLTMGPWYTLPDEFLVSGETLVRNLRLGLAKAAELGTAMAIGYLPDMFGHVAQMPQILAGFGMTDAVVWRGVPAAIDAPAFWWVAPDGSRVRAELLPDGYSNGARLPEHGPELAEQVEAFRLAYGHRVGDPILWMNGTDHQLPQPRLGRVVAEANAAQDQYHFTVTSLAHHLEVAPRDDLPTWHGELRSGATANLLMGVASCRVDVKQAAARAERWLERVAEPLATCWLPAEDHPHAFLDWAWREVIRNAAHDSICGCSADEVNDAVLHRYAEATRVAEAISDRALVRVLAAARQPAVAVNPTSRARAGVVTAIVEGDVAPPHTQQLSVRPARQRLVTVDRTEAVQVVLRAAMEDPRVSRARLNVEPGGEVVATIVADRSPKAIDANTLRTELEALAADDPAGLVHLEVQRPHATQEVLLRTPEVPGFGWRGLAPADLSDHAVRATGQGLTNGLVTVIPDQGDGTFSIDGIGGLGRIVDDGDVGDTYNWSPPDHDGLVDRPIDVDVLVTEAGPVRGRIQITRRYRWPTHVQSGRRVGATEVDVVTLIELRAQEDLVRVSVRFDNRAADHRVRMWFPLPEPAQESHAECAFGVVARGLEAEGGPNEVGLPTFPSRRFVEAGGLLVAHHGLCEYELVDVTGEPGQERAGALALTLLRCVGVISQGPMAMRSLPAGPATPTPAAQMAGPQHLELVLRVRGAGGAAAGAAVSDLAFTPLLTARMPGGSGLGDPEAWGQALRTDAEVSSLTRRADGRQELRVYAGAEASVLRVEGRSGDVTDLAGNPTGDRLDDEIALRPHQIVTVALDPPAEG